MSDDGVTGVVHPVGKNVWLFVLFNFSPVYRDSGIEQEEDYRT